MFQHVWNVDPCLRTRISFQHCVSNTLGLWFRVWVQAFASCFLGQTRFDFGSLLCTSTSLHPCLKHVWIKVPCLRTRISPPALCFECVWIVDLSLCTRIRLQPCSNTFDNGGLLHFLRGMWEYFTLSSAWARKILADAAQEKTGRNARSVATRVSLQRSFGASQKKSADTDCNAQMMRRAYNAKKLGNWESFKRNAGKNESSVNGLLRGFRRLVTRLPWRISAA